MLVNYKIGEFRNLEIDSFNASVTYSLYDVPKYKSLLKRYNTVGDGNRR